MKKSSIIFLQVLVVLIGIATLTFLLVEPHFEGRNINSTFFEVYFKDPFLAYAYVASIAFFTGLFQIFKVLGFVKDNQILTPQMVKALQTIKYSAMAVIGFVIGGVIILLIGESDDRPPIIMMGTIVILGSTVVALTASKFERLLK